jgi:hypothetical protein
MNGKIRASIGPCDERLGENKSPTFQFFWARPQPTEGQRGKRVRASALRLPRKGSGARMSQKPKGSGRHFKQHFSKRHLRVSSLTTPATQSSLCSYSMSVIVKKFCHQNIYFLSLPTLLSVCLTYQWPHCESNPSIRTCVRRYTIRERQFRLSKYNTNHSVGVDQIYGQRTRIRL